MLFWRGGNWKPTFSFIDFAEEKKDSYSKQKTDDFSWQWAPSKEIIVGKAARPYIKYEHHQIIVEDNRKNKMDKIHMAFTDGHPRDVTTNSIYYACLDENSLTKGARNNFTLGL